jgi:hypothetical protein
MKTPIMIKVAASTRKKPGYWAKQMAMGRALGTYGPFVTNKEVVRGRTKRMLPMAALGGLSGAAVGKLSKSKNVPLLALVSAAAAGLIGKRRHDRDYLENQGFRHGLIGVKDMTPEAKKKYLDEKYEGGGYNK